MRFLPTCLFLGLLVFPSLLPSANAQDTDVSSSLPKPPEGWKYTTAKDGSFSFLFPSKTSGSGSRQQSFRRKGLTGRIDMHYCSLSDGGTLACSGMRLSGTALKGMKIKDVYNLMLDMARENATDVSEPSDFMVGKLKGKEIYYTKNKRAYREVFVVVKGRVYDLVVTGPDKEKTMTKTAETFLKSLVLPAKAAPPKDGKSKAKDKAGDSAP